MRSTAGLGTSWVYCNRSKNGDHQGRSRQRDAIVSRSQALIARLKLEIDKFAVNSKAAALSPSRGSSSKMELHFGELEGDAGENELVAEIEVKALERKHPPRRPFPGDIPRERVVMAVPTSCPCSGSSKLLQLGENITQTLEFIPG